MIKSDSNMIFGFYSKLSLDRRTGKNGKIDEEGSFIFSISKQTIHRIISSSIYKGIKVKDNSWFIDSKSDLFIGTQFDLPNSCYSYLG